MKSVVRTPIKIQRTPIKLGREAIKIQRTPIILSEKDKLIGDLNWDFLYEKYNSLIWWGVRKVWNQRNAKKLPLDLSINDDDLYQEGMLLLIKCLDKYKELTMNNFTPVLIKSLFRHLNKKIHCSSPTVDLTDYQDDLFTNEEFDIIFLEYGMGQIRELLCNSNDMTSMVASAILEELVTPSDRTIWEVQMDVARKTTLKNMGKTIKGCQRINVPNTMKIKKCHIQQALGLSNTQYNSGIRKLKEVVSSVF